MIGVYVLISREARLPFILPHGYYKKNNNNRKSKLVLVRQVNIRARKKSSYIHLFLVYSHLYVDTN